MTALPGLKDGKLKDLTLLRQGPLARALAALNGGGEETRLVGGAVRDLALGERAVDFDLTTTATTDEVIRRAREAGFKVALTGIEHGTVTVVVDGRPIETTTLRQDVETDGRWAKVAFGRDFAADARRRDFTINALSLSADGTVHDTVGGSEDLAAGRVRFIGDAEARIREDYLRILRFFRFSARYAANGLDREGLSATTRSRWGLARLSRERVRAEFMKLLVAPRASEVVQTMGECGFLEPILGCVGYTRRLSRLVAIEAERGEGADAVLRLAALGVAIPEDADRLRDAAAALQCRSEPAESGHRGAHRPARDNCAPVVPPPQNPPIQRRTRGRSRRADAFAGRVRSACVGRRLRRRRPVSRQRARAQAPDQRRGPHCAQRVGRAPSRTGFARLPGDVDPDWLSEGTGDPGAPARGGGRRIVGNAAPRGMIERLRNRFATTKPACRRHEFRLLEQDDFGQNRFGFPNWAYFDSPC